MRSMPNRYFRRQWDELRSADHTAWGVATYYFETDEALTAIRQVEVYTAGQRLRYDGAHPEDEHGFLSDGPIFPDDEWPDLFEITGAEFETEWHNDRNTVAPGRRRPVGRERPSHKASGRATTSDFDVVAHTARLRDAT